VSDGIHFFCGTTVEKQGRQKIERRIIMISYRYPDIVTIKKE
jgi:hypothetical protein